MDEESLIEMMHRWNHIWDEEGWQDILYLKFDKREKYYYYLGSDLKKWDAYSRTASSPGLGMIIGW